MQRANPKQKEILKENYGRDDPENVAAVKGLYESLNLREVYAKFEEVEHNNILGLIQQLHQGGSKGSVSPDVFHFFLNKIHKRVKWKRHLYYGPYHICAHPMEKKTKKLYLNTFCIL